MRVRVEPHRVVGQRGEERGLGEVERLGVDAEIGERGSLDPIEVCAHRGAVAVGFENGAFGVPALEPHRTDRLCDLPAPAWLRRLEHARELHGDGRGPAGRAALAQGVGERAREGLRIDGPMLREPRVFGCQNGEGKVGRDPR